MEAAGSGRILVAERGLIPKAVAALTPLMDNVSFEQLSVVKGRLRNFFSDRPWTAADHAALAAAVGAPSDASADRTLRVELASDLVLLAGWIDGAFALDVEVGDAADSRAPNATHDLSSSFSYGIVPQPTPNPRTLRFATSPTGVGASVSHTRGTDDARVSSIFAVDDDVVDVLVGPDFVAVSVRRPARWPELLEPLLRAVAVGYGGGDEDIVDVPQRGATPGVDVRGGGGGDAGRDGGAAGVAAPAAHGRVPSNVQRAWRELGRLRASEPDDLARIVDAAAHDDPAHRQVASYLLADAPAEVARTLWASLAADKQRSVRRAALDAVVDAEREALRPVLEAALADGDGWIRWKAVNGLAALGADASRMLLEPLRDDGDFRVRLEATRALDGARRG